MRGTKAAKSSLSAPRVPLFGGLRREGLRARGLKVVEYASCGLLLDSEIAIARLKKVAPRHTGMTSVRLYTLLPESKTMAEAPPFLSRIEPSVAHISCK